MLGVYSGFQHRDHAIFAQSPLLFRLLRVRARGDWQFLRINLEEPLAWPKTRADLADLTPSEECKKYSPACIPEEVGCNWFAPITYRGAKVPGRFKPAEVGGGEVLAWNDQCDGKCVGYAAYREMPSNYSNGRMLIILFPQAVRLVARPRRAAAVLPI